MSLGDEDAMNGSAHASTSSIGLDFALDPSLSLAESLTAPPRRVPLDPLLGGSWSDDDDDGGLVPNSSDDDSLDDDDDAHSESSDETDAEEELVQAQQRAGRKRARAGGDKGKGRATALDGGDGPVFDDEGEELGRLISAIRESDSGGVGARTALEKEFDRQIEEELDDIDTQGLFEGRTRRKQKGKFRGGRKAAVDVEPSAEVKNMLGVANRSYALGELDEAIATLTEVVRIDPSVRMPWFTLATIHEERGEVEKSVMFKMVGTHLGGPRQSAADWAVLGGQSRDLGLLQQAIYCFSQAIKADKNDVDSMWDRAFLLKVSGSTRQATRAFTALLEIHPHDPGVLRELTPLLATLNQHDRATNYLLAAYDFFRAKPRPADEADLSTFGPSDLESLADFLCQQKRFGECVHIVKEGVRWLQGREREKGWDALEDDREFDEERKTRPGWQDETAFLEETPVHDLDVRLRVRLGVARMGLREYDEARAHFEIVTRESVAEFPELFGAVADAYFEHKMWDDAIMVYQDMAEDELTNGVPVWMKIGECNEHIKDFDGARECFTAVVEEEPDNLPAKFALARVLEQLGENEQALILLKDIMKFRRDQRQAGVRVPRLAGLLQTTREMTSARRKQAGPGAGGAPRELMLHTPERPLSLRASNPAATGAQRAAERAAREEQRQHEFKIALLQLDSLDALIDEGGDPDALGEWLALATYLVDSFRETRQLFPSDGKRKFTGMTRAWKRRTAQENDLGDEAERMQDRMERQMDEDEDHSDRRDRGSKEAGADEVDDFRGLDFDGWLSLIVKYAFRLTMNDEAEAGQETLHHVQSASPFKLNPKRSLSLRLARIACFIHVGDLANVVQLARNIILQNQFHTDSLRLLQALVPSGQAATEAYNHNPLQKFTIRQLRLIEDVAKGAPTKLGTAGQVLLRDETEEEENYLPVDPTKTFVPTKSNPAYLAAYAGMLICSRSWQSAIIYLLRAYDGAPGQPVILLGLAVAYLSRAMSRQTDNREHQIAQAFGWLSQYREQVGPGQEVEFNFGRAFHQLGLNHYAVKHYEQCLAIALTDRLAASSLERSMQVDGAEPEPKEFDDYAKAAAYNLSTLYALLGKIDRAKKVADQWLAV